MILDYKMCRGKFILHAITLVSIILVALLTIHIEYAQTYIDNAQIVKSEPHKYYVANTRQISTLHFHWTKKENIQPIVLSLSIVNPSFFSITPVYNNESIISKMMMDRFLMPIKLNSTFI